MADSEKQQSISSINPCVFHIQKLGLELKCPLCLNLLNRPYLLPCDHVFCNSCLPGSTQFGSQCPVCKAHYVHQDLRAMLLIENIITTYRSLTVAFCANLSQLTSSDTGQFLESKENNSAQVPLNCSVEDGFQKTDMAGRSCVSRDTKNKAYNVIDSGEDGRGCEQNTNSLPRTAQMRTGDLLMCENVEADQLSPCSPPSFGDIKSSENDSNNRGGDNSPEHYEAANSVKRNSYNVMRNERHDGLTSGTEEIDLRGLKRHKKLNHGPPDLHANSDALIRPIASRTENLETCFSELEHKNEFPDTTTWPSATSDPSSLKTVCGFCQSSKISKDTGPMLHYAKGKLVEGDAATLSNVIHVHHTCVEWAPQVYYVGENVKNLETELKRGAKFKCTKCRLKGAALGCYVKSCRTCYHAPCAMEVANCRWDYENYLILCPAHSSFKFPNEKPQKNILKHHAILSQIHSASRNPEPSNFLAESSKGVQCIFSGSALSPEEKCLLVEFGSMIGVPVIKFWKQNVTHVIAAIDTKGACTRTLKVLMAILHGKWVLTIDWVKACLESKCLVEEEPYEVSLDNHGSCNGPKNGRLSALNNAPKLFEALNFYFVGDFLPAYKEDLLYLVCAAGGTILRCEEELMKQGHNQEDPSRTLIVYNLDSPQGCKLGEEVSIIWERLNEAEGLAAKSGSQVIGHTWLLESIATYKLQPFVN